MCNIHKIYTGLYFIKQLLEINGIVSQNERLVGVLCGASKMVVKCSTSWAAVCRQPSLAKLKGYQRGHSQNWAIFQARGEKNMKGTFQSELMTNERPWPGPTGRQREVQRSACTKEQERRQQMIRMHYGQEGKGKWEWDWNCLLTLVIF